MKKDLQRRIARLEKWPGGKTNPFVQMMRDQLRRLEEGPERSVGDLYITGSVKRSTEQ